MKYKGTVYLLKNNPTYEIDEVKKLINSFKTYWFYGYSPILGADRATHRPAPEGHRHIHIAPEYLDKKWMAWQKSTCIKVAFNEKNVPTSDSGIFYFVCKDRNAYIFDYVDKNMHKYINSAEFREKVGTAEDILYGKNICLMSFQEQNELFDDKWIA